MVRLRSPALTRAWLGALACTGVLVTHWLAYRIAVPDVDHRGLVLEATGHGYLDYAVAVALGTLVAALAGFAWGRAAGGDGGVLSRPALYRLAATRLIALQGAAFAALEFAERAMVGEHPLELFHEPVLILGVIVQALIALGAAFLLIAFATVLDRLRRSRAPVPLARPTVLTLRPRRARVGRRPLVALGGTGLRSPPL